MPAFRTSRNVEISTLQFLETQLEAAWDNLEVVKSFNQAYDKNVNPPIVAVYLERTNDKRREIGSTALSPTYAIAIDVFATSDGQRIDLADFIVDKLKDGWVYNSYAHQSGSPQTLVATADGRISVISFDNNSPIRFGGNVEAKDRFRHSIQATVRKS